MYNRHAFLIAVVTLGILLPNCGGSKKSPKQVKKTTKRAKGKSLHPRIRTSIKNMTIQETRQERNRVARETADIARLIALDNRILSLSNDANEIKNVRFERAQAYEANENFRRSRDAYQEFMMLYPGSKQAEFAHFKAIEIGTNIAYNSACDQTPTTETITQAHEFIKTYGQQSEHHDRVVKLLKHCNNRLLECEMGVCGFYLHTYHYSKKPEALTAAKQRLEEIKETFKNTIPELDKRIEPLVERIAELEGGKPKKKPRKKKSETSNDIDSVIRHNPLEGVQEITIGKKNKSKKYVDRF